MGDVATTTLPEDNVINRYMQERKLDLKADHSESEINSSGAICMVGTKDQDILRTYENIESPSLKTKGNIIINPIFKISSEKGGIKLTRTDVNKIYRTEYPLTFKYIPQKYTISGNLAPLFQGRNLKLQGNLPASDKKELDEMLRKFIILQVPEKYI
jgi:hypothetical protein